MKSKSFSQQGKTSPDAVLAALRERFEQCRQALRSLEWISEGSVGANHPGTWRWTRKVAGRTVTVALSNTQARAFRQAIAEQRRLKKLLQQMRILSQEALLRTIPGPTRRPSKKRPKSFLS